MYLSIISEIVSHIHGWTMFGVGVILIILSLLLIYLFLDSYRTSRDALILFPITSKYIFGLCAIFASCYIMATAIQEEYFSDVETGTIIEYHYSDNVSKARITNGTAKHKNYNIIGLANNYVFNDGDKIKYNTESYNIYNIKSINDEIYQKPFGKHHTLILYMIIVNTWLMIEGFIYTYIRQPKMKNTTRRDAYYIGSFIVVAIFISSMMFIVTNRPVDTRTFDVSGQIQKIQTDKNNDHYTNVFVKDKHNITHVVKATPDMKKGYDENDMIHVKVNRPRNIMIYDYANK